MSKILMVEDDENLGTSLNQYLKGESFAVTWCKNIAEGKENFTDAEIVILDWMLPDGQGIDLLKIIRAEKPSLPVIMLTARTDLIDKVIGLESGADDYVTKPFEPRELVARIRTQLRKAQHVEEPSNDVEKIIIDELEMDLVQRKVFWDGKEREFTKMEFDFLRLLAEAPNRAFSREEVLNKVWGYDNYPSTRTVDTHVLQIRQKTRDTLIETVRGIGYRLKA